MLVEVKVSENPFPENSPKLGSEGTFSFAQGRRNLVPVKENNRTDRRRTDQPVVSYFPSLSLVVLLEYSTTRGRVVTQNITRLAFPVLETRSE